MPSPTPSPKRRKIPASKGVASMAPGVAGFDAAADQVAAAIQARGMTTSDLAEASGVSRVALSNWMNGKRPLRADYLVAVVLALGGEIKIPAKPGR